MNEVDSRNAQSAAPRAGLTSIRGTAVQSSGLADSAATLDAFSEVFARIGTPQVPDKTPSPAPERAERSPREIDSAADDASDEGPEKLESDSVDSSPESIDIQVEADSDQHQNVDLPLDPQDSPAEPGADVADQVIDPDGEVQAEASETPPADVVAAEVDELDVDGSAEVDSPLLVAGPDDRVDTADLAVARVAVDVQAEDVKRTEKTQPVEPKAVVHSEKTDVSGGRSESQTPDAVTSPEAVSTGQEQSGSGDGRRDRQQGPSERFTDPQAASSGQPNSAAQGESSSSGVAAIESAAAVAPSGDANPADRRGQSAESVTARGVASIESAKSVAPGIVGVSASAADSARNVSRPGQGEPIVNVATDRIAGSEGAAKSKAAQQGASVGDTANRVKLIQRVSKAFQHVGADGGSIRIRLAPEELGTVRIEMQVQNKQVRARVVAETEAASQVLRENLPDLRSRLETMGVAVEQIDVETEGHESSLGNFGGNRQNNRDSNDQAGHGGRRSSDFAETQQAASRPAPLVRPELVNASASGVDLKL